MLIAGKHIPMTAYQKIIFKDTSEKVSSLSLLISASTWPETSYYEMLTCSRTVVLFTVVEYLLYPNTRKKEQTINDVSCDMW